MSDMYEMLAAPFDPSEVDWRVGPTTKDKSKGQALCYIDARTVMDRLDMVCGPQGWQNRYVMEGTKTVCEIGIKCGEEWVWKADGAGDSDIEAEKGALSDAFKRSAVRWGIGRYLYNLKSPWVALKAFGNSYAIADEAKPELEAILRRQMPQPTPLPVDEKLATAKSFVRKAIREVGECKTVSDVDIWYATWAKHIAAIQKGYPEEAAILTAAINAQRGSFKAAAE